MQNYALLMKACINGLYTIVQEILQKQDIEINSEWYSSTPLMAACSNGHNNIVKLLLEHKADPNYISSIGNTALMRAVSAGNLETVTLLLEYGADPNGYLSATLAAAHSLPDSTYWYSTPLLRAVYKGHIAIVERLLAYGADAEYKQSSPPAGLLQPILVAVQWYNADTRRALVRLLLEYKADPSITLYHHGFEAFIATPAFYAAMYNDEILLDMLITYGLQFKASALVGYQTPLHVAVIENNKSLVKKLLARGLFIDAQDEEGKTPLYYTKFKDTELVSLLIEAGANKEHKDKKGRTPLWGALNYTLSTGVITPIENALAYAVEVNTQDNKGNSPVILLLKLFDLDHNVYIREYIMNALEILVQAQANLTLANDEGQTALSLAQKHGITLWT